MDDVKIVAFLSAKVGIALTRRICEEKKSMY